MELQVNAIQIPESISFNYEELKRELSETMTRYEALVYTPEQMKEAKADRAALNKLKKALNDERIRLEREYMKPFADFKGKIAELVTLIDKPCSLIDRQVKDYEEQQKEQKRQLIAELFEKITDRPEWLKLEQIFVPSWLNASCSMKTVSGDIEIMLQTIRNDLAALSEMPSFAFEAIEVYKQTLNVQTAINEGKRLLEIQQRKEAESARAAAEAQQTAAAEPEPVADDLQDVEEVQQVHDAGTWVSFRCLLTVNQAYELREFFDSRGIRFEALK